MTKPRLDTTQQLTTRGGTRKWDQLSKQVAREEPVCWLRLPGCTVRSTSADHIYPRKTHPRLRMTRSNLRGVCRKCNQRRGDTPVWDIPKLRARLEQRQRPAKALKIFR